MMKEEEITYRIRKYYIAKKFGTLNKEYPVVGNIRDTTKNLLERIIRLITK